MGVASTKRRYLRVGEGEGESGEGTGGRGPRVRWPGGSQHSHSFGGKERDLQAGLGVQSHEVITKAQG